MRGSTLIAVLVQGGVRGASVAASYISHLPESAALNVWNPEPRYSALLVSCARHQRLDCNDCPTAWDAAEHANIVMVFGGHQPLTPFSLALLRKRSVPVIVHGEPHDG